jgi:nucleoside-diphosphate-sugar epimerase
MAVTERFLVTGALGCLGAHVCRLLVAEDVPVVAYDLGTDPHRLRLIMPPEHLERITFLPGDVTDLAQIEQTIAEHQISNVVHLAALQVPFCRADPVLGARVNVVGTVNVFEAVKNAALTTPVVYASSAAVYDRDANVAPATLYGVYKQANEGTARIYAQDAGIASVGLRPFSVYGPARDQGVTSTPTEAMLAAARGEPYRISFGGRTQFHFAPDVARAFIQASRSSAQGAAVYNLGGPATSMDELVAAIHATVPDAEITYEETGLPFPGELPQPWFDAPLTPLEDGVRETIELFRRSPTAVS